MLCCIDLHPRDAYYTKTMSRFRTHESLSVADSECVTGFTPRDTYTPAPTTIPSAREAFTPPQREEGVFVDPIAHLTAREIAAHRKRVADIIRAQQAAVFIV